MIVRLVIVLSVVTPFSDSWSLDELHHSSQFVYSPFQKRSVTKILNFWRNDTKEFNRTSCKRELVGYESLPNITTSFGPIYNVKELNRFKKIGESFLNTVKRKSLYETVKLTMELSPINSIDKVLQIIEYQLTLFILIAFGVVTATIILVVYVVFWSMKLTGNIQEVNMQRIADSEGSTRLVLSFLLLLFTTFVIFGCTIAWVANTHITNNVKEAQNQITWAVTVTESYISQIQSQMESLFMQQYRVTYINRLSEILNDSIHSAAADVYLKLEHNISDTYNKSLHLAYSISNVQFAAFNSLHKEFQEKDVEKKLIKYTTEMVKAQTCITTLQKWCDQNANKCDDSKKPKSSYLDTVNPALMYRVELVNATADVNHVTKNGKINEEAEVGYRNGWYFHNGSMRDPTTRFFTGSPSLNATCDLFDKTTGQRLYLNTTHNATLSVNLTCSLADGCGLKDQPSPALNKKNSSTRIYSGSCCMTIDYVMTEDREKKEIANQTLHEQCGTHKTVTVGSDGTKTETYLYQSDYRGNVSTTLGGLQCLTWGDIMVSDDDSLADAAADAKEPYLGLYYQDNSNLKHNFCRNPMILNVFATTEEEVRKRAWCVTYINESTSTRHWEYCDVPYCRNDTTLALEEQKLDVNNTNFTYKTCQSLKDAIFGNTATAQDFTLWQATDTARKEAYFSLEESVKEMNAQYKVIQSLFNDTNAAFDKLKDEIVNSITSGSEASKFDNYRNIGTIVIVCFCMLSACLAVAGVCMGYCNLTDVPPHLRTSACSLGGRLIKISSYWAAMMAIINLYMATLFFLPGALFSLVCTDFENDALFDLFDKRILVNYSILGRAILGNDTYYDMTFERLYQNCSNNQTLWVALTLNTNPDYQLSDMIQVNETLDVNYTFDRLRNKDVSMNFKDFPMFPKLLETPLIFWNQSNATQIPWRSVKNNFKNKFMGTTKETLKSKDNDAKETFCKQFNKWASDVDATVTGNTLECRTNFTDELKNQCDSWLDDYDDMNDILDKMRPHVNTIEGEWSKYGDSYLIELLDQYNYTNMNLMYTSDTQLSKAIINQSYSYWQKVMQNEVGCYDWLVNDTMINEFTMCFPVYKIIKSTMGYFCDYMVTTMTLVWMSQGLIGFILALHMLVASSLSTYFIKMEVRHPDDISKEEIIAGFK